MADWTRERLGDHAQISARIGWRGLSADEYVDSGPFLIAGKHIVSGSVNWAGCDHLTENRYRESPEIALQVGDVIISKDGTIGRVARIDSLPGPATLNGTMMLVRPTGSFDHRYLSHVLNGSAFRQLVEERISGSSVPHLFQRDLITLPVSLPPLAEQRRIAGILDTIDELIQATERVVSKLTCANEGVIGTAIEAAALTGHQSTVEREFEIETGIALNASRVPRSNPVGYLRVANVQRSEIDTSDIATMEATEDEVRRKALAVGDLLVVEGHASPNEIGRCAVAPRSAEGLLFQNHLFRLRPSSMPSDLARMILNSAEAKAYWRRVCATSSGLHTINSSMLRAMPISVPRRDHQRVLSALIVACDSSVSTEQQELRRLRELRSGLAADLLSGRVRTVAA